jgi:hypothetical protein
MKENESKYTPDMLEKAYSILASGGTHEAVYVALDISRETFYQWLGRGKYKNSKYFKPDLSDYIKKGEAAGRVWLENELKKAATEKFAGNPTMLIYLAKRRDTSGKLLPKQKNKTYRQKLDGITDLYTEGMISTDTYEQLLRCLEKDAGVMDKVKYEELELEVKDLKRKVTEIMLVRQEGSQC